MSGPQRIAISEVKQTVKVEMEIRPHIKAWLDRLGEGGGGPLTMGEQPALIACIHNGQGGMVTTKSEAALLIDAFERQSQRIARGTHEARVEAYERAQQAIQDRIDERLALWKKASDAVRLLHVGLEALGRNSEGGKILRTLLSLMSELDKLPNRDPPVLFRPDLLPEHIARQHGVYGANGML